MRKPLVIQWALLLIAAAILFVGSSYPANAAKKCIPMGEKSVCFDDGTGKKGNDGGGAAGKNDNDKNGNTPKGEGDQPKADTKPLDCSKAQCDPGYIKLDKPNKYQACCQAIDRCPPERPSGTPPNCCEAGLTFREGACRPTNCPPGTVGTPPHCDRVCGPGKIKVGQSCYDPCPAGTTGTPPNCSPSVPPPAGGKPYCVTCGGPGCLQKAPACPTGGLTTCTDVPGKTYYNCCCP